MLKELYNTLKEDKFEDLFQPISQEEKVSTLQRYIEKEKHV